MHCPRNGPTGCWPTSRCSTPKPSNRISSGQIGYRGRVPRGPGEEPRRYYFAVHPERLSGFVDLLTHPVLDAVCRNVLGDDYQFVEVGFDVALPGAVTQPLHRDFPIPEETKAPDG